MRGRFHNDMVIPAEAAAEMDEHELAWAGFPPDGPGAWKWEWEFESAAFVKRWHDILGASELDFREYLALTLEMNVFAFVRNVTAQQKARDDDGVSPLSKSEFQKIMEPYIVVYRKVNAQ